jgi:hypothetical protein
LAQKNVPPLSAFGVAQSPKSSSSGTLEVYREPDALQREYGEKREILFAPKVPISKLEENRDNYPA